MKKAEFYTRYFDGENCIAKKVNGYTDGNFYFYKGIGGYWHGIEPKTGLAASGAYGQPTRKKAVEELYKNLVEIEIYMASCNGRIQAEKFNELIEIAKKEEER